MIMDYDQDKIIRKDGVDYKETEPLVDSDSTQDFSASASPEGTAPAVSEGADQAPVSAVLSDPGATVSAMTRCDYSDLLVENCGHCQGTPNLWEGPSDADDLKPEQIEGTWAVAQYDGSCGCGCNGRVSQGDEIVLAKVDDVEEWVLLEHARRTWSPDHWSADTGMTS